jgi:hypothetical protein
MQTPTVDVASLATLTDILKHDLGVKESYRHTPKWVTPGDPIRLGSARDPRAGDGDPPSRTLTSDHARLQPHDLAHRRLQRRGRDSLGFVIDSRSPDRSVALPCDQCLSTGVPARRILHRCGSDFYFLIVNTWRGNNEVWETVFYKDGAAMADFAPFPREGTHKPTFCVWELAPVWSRDGGRSDFSSQHGIKSLHRLGWAITMLTSLEYGFI